ncbi:helix-turn-helix domain-containing protein [Pseudomonas poae]|nr:helix-turn-helix domain-containing protein [Pseudomonas poae]
MTKSIATVQVGILLYPGAQRSAVYGITDIFVVANQLLLEHPEVTAPNINVSNWQLGDQGSVVCDDVSLGTHCPDIVIVPPCLGDHLDVLKADSFVTAVKSWHSAGALVSSVCAGAYLLAEAGLLNGRTATTHWSLANDLAIRYPPIRVNVDRMIIDHSDVITAGGLMAWTDLGLTLVERLLGSSIAAETARFLVLDPARHSQQCFKRFVPNLSHGDEVILKTQHWLHTLNGQTGGIINMAKYANLGERTLLRRFHHATGLTPTEYCQALRVGKACELLEFTNRSIEHIAWAVGYRDTGAFRRLFNKATGLAPANYRSRFGAARKR